MGNFCGNCFKVAEDGVLIQPEVAVRRQQAAEAAERRLQQQENRGVKNPESVKRMEEKQKRLEELERQTAIQGGQPNMRWQAD